MNIQRRERCGGAAAGRTGFTLMEVLLVLVILVVLASMAVQMFGGTREQALIDATRSQVGLLKRSIDLYESAVRRYPESLDGLITRPSGTEPAFKRWAGPYLERMPLDSWDREFKYAAPGKHNPNSFDLWSVGPDGQDGTDDDIGNWE
jgi:general secretion pathway protein G